MEAKANEGLPKG